jgi:Spy/CpxP family protein refolding chaperone
MKKVILNVALAVVFMFTTVVVVAQGAATPPPAQAGTPASQTQPQPPRKPLTPEEKADRQTTGLTKRLTLTTDQVPKVKEVILASVKQEDADRTAAGTDKDKMIALRKTREDNKKAALKKILTPEQWEKFNAAPAHPNPAGNPGGTPAQTPPPAPTPAGK